MSHPQQDTAHHDLIIVGAGILGSALAHALGSAEGGRKVLLIERDWSEPDRIVGELLQPGGVRALQSLGLEGCLENIDSIPCTGYGIFYGQEEVSIVYPKHKQPNTGRSFHHGKFVMKLRDAARRAIGVKTVEATANELIRCEITGRVLGVTYTQKKSDGSTVIVNSYASLTVVADGCFSKFRKQLVKKEVRVKSNFIGYELIDCDLPYKHKGNVVLAKPSPVLMYQIGTHETRILIDIPGKLPSSVTGELQNYIRSHVCPQLPKSVQPSLLKAIETQRSRYMPNSFLPPSINRTPGVILVGDALNMRHPLTGGGMTVALCDVVHLKGLLGKGLGIPNSIAEGDVNGHVKAVTDLTELEADQGWAEDGELERVGDLADDRAVRRAMKTLHWRRKKLSGVINILAQALYELFAAGDDPNMKALQVACFSYFQLGGRCEATPMGLLGGLIPEPLTLVGHFFAVAFHGVWLILKGHPWYLCPVALWRGVLAVWTASCVILPVIFTELRD